jgi:hypothetical protein
MDRHDDLTSESPNESSAAARHGAFYRLGANQSNASIFEDVEMAHDQVSRNYCPFWNPANKSP